MKVIYLDMDGVIVDMQVAALRLFGQDTQEAYDAIDGWDRMPAVCGVSEREFWGRIEEEGAEFWAALPWTSYGRNLLSLCERYSDHVVLMSTPTRDTASLQGKAQWIQRNLPEHLKRSYSLTPVKPLHASPLRVLIDDSDRNVENFRDAGGRGFLWPQPWNRNRDLCSLEEKTKLLILESALRTWTL